MAEQSEKSYVAAVCMSAIFGTMGIHLFYLGRYIEGVVDLGLFIAAIFFLSQGQYVLAVFIFAIDLVHTFIITIMLLVGTFKDGEGKIIPYPGQKLN